MHGNCSLPNQPYRLFVKISIIIGASLSNEENCEFYVLFGGCFDIIIVPLGQRIYGIFLTLNPCK